MARSKPYNQAEMQLYRRSRERLRQQRAFGPTPMLRDCSKSWEYGWTNQIDGRRACRSDACRPGDPWGCSALKIRRFRVWTSELLRRWLRADRAAFIGLFEVTGERSGNLAELWEASSEALKAAVQKRRRSLQSAGASGFLYTRAVTRSVKREWIVRRWVVVGFGGELDAWALQSLSARVGESWDDSAVARRGVAAARFVGFAPVQRHEVDAVAQVVVGDELSTERGACLDASSVFRDSIKLSFGICPDELTPESMARLYYEGVGSGRGRLGDSYVEYATSMGGIALWNAYANRGDISDVGRAWNECLSAAKSVPVSHLPYPGRKRAPSYREKRRRWAGCGKK